jgi:hypothetical protein
VSGHHLDPAKARKGCSLQAQNVHYTSQSVNGHHQTHLGQTKGQSGKKEQAVKTSMCTYNIGALKWGYWVGLNPFIGSFRLLMLAFQVSYNLDKLKGLLFQIKGFKLWLHGRFGCSVYYIY